MSKYSIGTLKGDLAGGFSAAMMSLPANIIYGIIGFAPLGPDFLGMGILAGIYSSVFAGFLTSAIGGGKGMITCACATMVLVFASVMRQVIATGTFDPTVSSDAIMIIGAGFMTLLFAGVIQIMFGLLKLSNLIRYISAPVIAGILNGTAFLIASGAVLDFLGLPKMGMEEFVSSIDRIQPLTVIVAVSSILLWLKGPKLLPQVPGPMLGLIGGVAVYYIFQAFGFGDQLGPRLQALPDGIPVSRITTQLPDLVAHASFMTLLPIMLTGAVIIAILGSIESLLAVLTLQNLTNEKTNGNRELLGQGIGNAVNALLGALPAGGAVSRVIVNYKAGGRTRASGFYYALFILIIVLLFSSYISYMPKAVTAGMAVVIAWLVIDKWSIRLAGDLVRKRTKNRRGLMINIGVILLVMFIVIRFNIIMAVTAGIVISIILFIEQMGKSVIRRVFRGSTYHSKKQRYYTVMEQLDRNGDQISVIELEGPLFFGAIDALSNQFDKLVADGTKFILLDFKRATNVDASAARFLEQNIVQLESKGVELVASYLYHDSPARNALEDMGVIAKLGEAKVFNDTEEALEYCEDRLLVSLKKQTEEIDQFRLPEFFGLTEKDGGLMDRISRYLRKVEYNSGDHIFKQGEKGDSAFIIAEGQAEVALKLPGHTRTKRLVTLSYGTIVGEMALLDSGIRSASVVALEKMSCYRIGVDDFQKMRKDDPDIAMILTETITRVLVGRLRQANQTISELER